jgi:hypothetical protein
VRPRADSQLNVIDRHHDLAAPPPRRGLLPAAYDNALHAARCLEQLRSKDKPIEKYIYLAQLKHTNEDLFYRLCLVHMPVWRSI